MSRSFASAFAWTVERPWLTLLVIAGMTAIAVVGYTAAIPVRSWFLALGATSDEAPAGETPAPPPAAASNPSTPAPENLERFNVTDADVILVVDSDQFFTLEGAAALRETARDLQALPYVADVLWMDRVPVLNLFGLNEPLLPRGNASPRQFDAAREKALQHPLLRGQLLSGDGRTLLMLVRLKWLFVTSDADCTEGLRQTAEQALARHPTVTARVLVTGKVPMYLTFMQSQLANQRKYQIIGYSMTGLMALILFRGLRAVLIVSLAPAMGVFWSLGVLRFFDVQDNPFNDIVLPVMLSLVGLTDGVHLMVQIRQQRAAGLSPRDAARIGLGKVGLACFLTSLTTAVGFASLGWAHHEIVREFGWSCMLGVAIVFVAVITTIPLASTLRLAGNLHDGLERGLIERHLERITWLIDAVLRYDRAVSWVAILLTVGLTALSLQLRPDERRSNALPTGSEAVVALRHMDHALGGLERGSVDIVWDDTGDDPARLLTVLGEVHALLAQEPLIGHPLSLHSLLGALPGGGPVAERGSMLDLLPTSLKRAFYEPERRRASVSFRAEDLGIATYGPVFLRLQAGLAAIAAAHPGFALELAGSAVDRWQNLHQIVVDLTSSLGSAAIVIFGVLMLAYRSVRLGLIAVVPNVFPLAVTGAYLVVTGQTLEIVSVCAFTVCLGIAVDDTIHFLTRYQEELEFAPHRQAIRRAFAGVGSSLIMTTLVLVVGFATVISSDLREQRIFATMGTIAIASALLGDLLLLPALLARFGQPAGEPGDADAVGAPVSTGGDSFSS